MMQKITRTRTGWKLEWGIAAMVAGALWATPMTQASAQDSSSHYDGFNRWCISNFGAEKEELTYRIPGKELKLIEGGLWKHESETSASIGFETNLPARARVEYGETAQYGKKTGEGERCFYVHLRTIKDLKPRTTYHYRLVAVDERGNQITSKDKTFRTRTLPNVVRIPQDMNRAPYVLDKEGTTYLVTRDLTIDGMAFDVTASGVTLDLGGNTVIYDNKEWGPVKPAKNFWDWIRNAKYGVRVTQVKGLKILNGTIRQGAGNDAAQSGSLGYNPVYARGCSGMEIAGLNIIYSGPQMIGFYNHWGGGDSEYHHNVFQDLGTKIINRHGAGSRALIFAGVRTLTGVSVHHNLVKRTRQGGLGGNEVYHNEVYLDSWATNSFGIAMKGPGSKAWGNRVLGGGYHVCAFGWGSKLTGHHNFVHLKAEQFPEKRWPEYGKAASVNALRLTQYGNSKREMEDNLYYENVFVIESKDGRQTRGVQVCSDPYVKNYVFRDNVVKIKTLDEKTTNGSCVVTHGSWKRTEKHLPVFYRNNTFISNAHLVKFGDGYAVGSNHHFINCRFVKEGKLPGFKTFIYGIGYPSKNHVFLDCTFEGGAKPDDVQWLNDTSDHDYALAWTLTVKTVPRAAVTITDKDGKQVFSGKAGADGKVSAPLTEYVNKAAGKTMHTPHTVKVQTDGRTATKEVRMDRKQEIAVTF